MIGLCGLGKSLGISHGGGDLKVLPVPTFCPSSELTIPWLTCPWGLLVMLFRLPYFASFPREIGSDWGLFSFTPLRLSCRFGTLFSSGTVGPFGGWDLGASLPQRGRSLGQLRAWSVPPALSAVALHYLLPQRGGHCDPSILSGSILPAGSLLCPFSSSAPCGVGGTPGWTCWALVLPVGSLSFIGY